MVDVDISLEAVATVPFRLPDSRLSDAQWAEAEASAGEEGTKVAAGVVGSGGKVGTLGISVDTAGVDTSGTIVLDRSAGCKLDITGDEDREKLLASVEVEVEDKDNHGRGVVVVDESKTLDEAPFVAFWFTGATLDPKFRFWPDAMTKFRFGLSR